MTATSINLELDELFYSYPDIDEPNFQTLISAKEEFRTLEASRKEPPTKQGEFFNPQKLVHRYLKIYDRLYVMAKAGTGKTCTVGGFTEQAKHIFLSGLHSYVKEYTNKGVGHIKRVYYLVKGPSTEDEVKRQLACVCSPEGEYNTKTINALNAQINKFYSILTYDGFYKIITQEIHDEQGIKDAFSGCIFIIDEAQNLRIDEETLNFESINDEGILTDKRKNKIKKKVEMYKAFWRVFHTIERSKIVLLSATPIVNIPVEIVYGMNLLLPADKQMDPMVNYASLPLENQTDPTQSIKYYFEGMVSFIIEQENEIIPVYIGQPMPTTYDIDDETYQSQLVLDYAVMSDYQYEKYVSVEERNKSFRNDQRQVAIFAYPDNSTGEQATKNWFDKQGNRYYMKPELVNLLVPTEQEIQAEINKLGKPNTKNLYSLVKQRLILRNVQKYGTKLANVINRVLKSDGVCFIYVDFVNGAGAILIGALLELFNFKYYNPTNRDFITSAGSEVKVICPDENIQQININKQLRYGVLYGDKTKNRQIINMANSSENWQGEYLKVVLGTPKSREGINLLNITDTELIGPGWNEAHNYQAIRRTIRASSGKVRLQKLRAKALAENRNPDDVRIKVNIALNAAIGPQGQETADTEIYEISERKNILTSKLMRKIKQCAIDCQINKERNTVRNPIDGSYPDGSAECDYDVCRYPCVDPAPQQIDYSSYDVLYSDEKVDHIIEELKLYFRFFSSISYMELFTKFSQYRSNHLIKAVEKMIKNDIILFDQYGRQSQLYSDNGIIFTKDEYGDIHNIVGDIYYSNNLIGVENVDLDDAMFELEKPSQNELMKTLLQLNTTDPRFDMIFDKLNKRTKSDLLERSLLIYLQGQQLNELQAYVINKLSNNTLITLEPTQAIRTLINKRTIPSTVKGRPAKKGVTEVNPMDIYVKTPTPTSGIDEQVIIHYTNNQPISTRKDVKSDIINNIRIYKPSERLGWRDATVYESDLYNIIIKENLKHSTDNQDAPYYGLMDGDVFKIVDRRNKGKGTGRVATTLTKDKLIDILVQLNIEPDNADIVVPTNQSEIDNIILEINNTKIDTENMTPRQLALLKAWLNISINKDGLVQKLKEALL